MIAQVWEYKVFGKQITKKNTREKKYKNEIDMKIKNNFLKDSLFLWFFQPLKTNKDKSFWHKNSLKTYCYDTSIDGKFLLLKFLCETAQEMGYI